MGLVVTEEGAQILWAYMLGITPPQNFNLHLFSTNRVPVHADTEAIFAAIELSVLGYTPIELLGSTSQWTILPTSVGAQATHVTVEWNFLAACSVWGYWLSDLSNTYSIMAQAFGEVYSFPSTGGKFQFTFPPVLTSS